MRTATETPESKLSAIQDQQGWTDSTLLQVVLGALPAKAFNKVLNAAERIAEEENSYVGDLSP